MTHGSYRVTQPSLFATAPRLKAVNQDRYYDSTGWWAVKCLDCQRWLTKYDFTREEAERYAADHRCAA